MTKEDHDNRWASDRAVADRVDLRLRKMILIPVSGRGGTKAWAKVDDEDAEALSQHRWFLHSRGYAMRIEETDRVRSIYMHRVISKPPAGLQVDHINRDPLDNRRSNLRNVTSAENTQNTGARPNSTSSHRGVSWDAARERWFAKAQLHKKQHFLGRFENSDDACAAVDRFWEAVANEALQ